MKYVVSKRYDLVVDSFVSLESAQEFEYKGDAFGFGSFSYGTSERVLQ